MIKLLLYAKHNIVFIWNIIEWINSLLFDLRYENRIKFISSFLVNESDEAFLYRLVDSKSLHSLSVFFGRQPIDYLQYFSPHKFDEESLSRLLRNKAFIMLVCIDRESEEIVGYFFLRCFFNGKVFRGKLVDVDYQGRGIAKHMGRIMTNICRVANFRIFATISKDNVKSIASSKAVNRIRIIKELPNNFVYVEYLDK